MKAQFSRIRLVIIASLAGALITLACFAPLVWAEQVFAPETETAQVPSIINPTTQPGVPTAPPETFVATLDWVDAKNLEPQCNEGGDLCIHTVQGTVKYYTPVPARIICFIASIQTGYSNPVDVGANASGTVTLTASDPEPVYSQPDQTSAFGCYLDGNGFHLVVSLIQKHDEAKVTP